MVMKRTSLILAGAIAAALLGGCASNDKKDDAASSSKYGLLNGGKRGSAGVDESKMSDAAEPALRADTRFAAGQLAESRGQLDCAIVQYDQALRLDAGHVPSLY